MWDMNFKIKAQASYADEQWTESSALENVIKSLQMVEVWININGSLYPYQTENNMISAQFALVLIMFSTYMFFPPENQQ